MSIDKPDHHDADLVLRLYEMRREPIMRESRNVINGQFWPRSYDDVIALTRPDNPMNAAFRQTSTYWEMVYGLAKHGIVNADYLVENSDEGLFLFAKIHPFVEQLRKDYSPAVFQNAEWITKNSMAGQHVFEAIKARIKAIAESGR
jgi:hypothetical protein